MQTQLEGGFRGRTNKLVDACYSFWQGGAFAVLRLIELGLDDCADCTIVGETVDTELQQVSMNCSA
jgi:prenyltransferase beta subunit